MTCNEMKGTVGTDSALISSPASCQVITPRFNHTQFDSELHKNVTQMTEIMKRLERVGC